MTKENPWRPCGAILVVYFLVKLAAVPCSAQSAGAKPISAKITPAEEKAEANLAAARTNPLQLRNFLLGLPKGTDLHYHLTGGVYAESFIRNGVADGLCVNVKDSAFVKCPADVSAAGDCPANWKSEAIVPAKTALCQQTLYDQLVNAFSMRGFVPYGSYTGHDHFFEAFAKFGAVSLSHEAEWVDEVAARAAAQNEQYMELIETPDFSKAAQVASEVPWVDDLAKLRDAYLAHGILENAKANVETFRESERKRRETEHCGQPDALAACKVDTRFLWQVLRGKPKELVFAQALVAFESAQMDPERIVGIDFVQPEDGYITRRDFNLHMKMVKYLHQVYPAVHISLHAGEITYGEVPSEDLCCHIRKAVEAGTERIGHGVDVMYEEHPHPLMRELAAKHIMVEINLTSNDVILGVSGKNHPFPLYRQFGVPVSLSSDDEGVSRIDLTNEYVRAVSTYGLHYVDLKKLARTGMEHAFLPGQSLWAERDEFSRTVNACAKDSLGAEKPSTACGEFLGQSEKAAQQWELERRFNQFEAGL